MIRNCYKDLFASNTDMLWEIWKCLFVCLFVILFPCSLLLARSKMSSLFRRIHINRHGFSLKRPKPSKVVIFFSAFSWLCSSVMRRQHGAILSPPGPQISGCLWLMVVKCLSELQERFRFHSLQHIGFHLSLFAWLRMSLPHEWQQQHSTTLLENTSTKSKLIFSLCRVTEWSWLTSTSGGLVQLSGQSRVNLEEAVQEQVH